MKLSAKQVDALRAVRDGRLSDVRVSGAGVLSVVGYHHTTVVSLIERGLLDMTQDDERFWKYHLSLTDAGRSLLAGAGD